MEASRINTMIRDEVVRLAIKREGELRKRILNPFHVAAHGSEYPVPTSLIKTAGVL